MYPPNFDYVRAGSLQEAVSLLQEREDAKLLAGGHSLIPLLKLRTTSVGTLVDIGRIADLKGVAKPNGSVSIGPLTTHTEIAGATVLPEAIREAAADIGDLQVRNRGTIGGNIAHADPASDHPTILTALGATIYMMGPSGQRFEPAASFFTDLFQTVLEPNEIVTGIEIPIPGAGVGTAYEKLSNPASGYAMLGVCAVIGLDGETCKSASLAIGGLTPKPMKAPSVKDALVGKTLDEAVVAEAAKAVEDDLGDFILGDIHTSAEYRKAMAPVFVRRAVNKAVERARM